MFGFPVHEKAREMAGVPDPCESFYTAQTLGNAMSLPTVGLILLTVLSCADMREGLSSEIDP